MNNKLNIFHKILDNHLDPKVTTLVSRSHSSKAKPITFIIPLQQRWRGYSNAAVYVWLSEWVRVSVSHALACGHDTVFAQSLSKFTRKFMMKGGTLLIVGQRSRSNLALRL